MNKLPSPPHLQYRVSVSLGTCNHFLRDTQAHKVKGIDFEIPTLPLHFSKTKSPEKTSDFVFSYLTFTNHILKGRHIFHTFPNINGCFAEGCRTLRMPKKITT